MTARGSAFIVLFSMLRKREQQAAPPTITRLLRAFADREKVVKRFTVPWFRVIFAEAKIKLGEAQEVFMNSCTDKAISLQGFLHAVA